MFKTFLSPALLVLALSPAAIAAPVMVQEIDVQVDLTAVTNAAAAERFATFEGDLENALTARLVDRIAEKGVDIIIDISEVELSNSFTEARGLADTRLVGTVKIMDLTNNSNYDAYVLTIDVNSQVPFFPVGTDVVTLPVDSEVYYSTMIEAFANAVVIRLDR
ncbi:MAG: hypothetical protein Q8P60_11100 [Pseudorhodobacter sp.]|nr:hypothetical protein [Pseudorhodobacter sp.]